MTDRRNVDGITTINIGRSVQLERHVCNWIKIDSSSHLPALRRVGHWYSMAVCWTRREDIRSSFTCSFTCQIKTRCGYSQTFTGNLFFIHLFDFSIDDLSVVSVPSRISTLEWVRRPHTKNLNSNPADLNYCLGNKAVPEAIVRARCSSNNEALVVVVVVSYCCDRLATGSQALNATECL